MIYYREKINSFTDAVHNCSVIVLLSENYNLLQKEAQKISDTIAGPKAEYEMRITRFFNKEINEKKQDILSSLRTKSFFPGRQIILLNGLAEKDCKIIKEIDTEWQNDDAITIVMMNELSGNSAFKKSVASSTRINLIIYPKQKIDNEFLMGKLAGEGMNFDGEEVLDTITDFAKFTPEAIFEREFEKLTLFKLNDNKPLSVDDFFNIISVNYEINELSLAVALAERNIVELEKGLSAFYSQGKSPIYILQFIFAYFYKLSLIKLHGPNSFDAKREYPFLRSNDLEKAKIHAKKWSLDQISRVADALTISDLKLRKYSLLFQRSILTQCFHKILTI